ncbi:glutathione S-transferase Mu 4-like protein [Camelus ferus]|nr:glutathione S-transferase Mu 4-like protein [Camelus ferus]
MPSACSWSTDSNYEKTYTMGDAPDYDRSQWLSEKFKLGLDFPNLPYLIDGAHRLTQSNAILRYIAHKHNMCGETEEEKIRVDVLENQAMDTSNDLARVCYSSDFEKLKPVYLKEIPEKMKLFSEFLGKRTWFAGDKGLKKIAAYMKSSCFLPGPLYTKSAVWGNK